MLSEERDGFDLKHIMTAIWQRRGFIALVVIAVVGMTMALTSIVPPRYTADALIALNTRATAADQVLSAKPVTLTPPLSSVLVRTEIDILTSRQLAAQVVQEFDLDQDPEFNPLLDDPETLVPAELRRTFEQIKAWAKDKSVQVLAWLDLSLPDPKKRENLGFVRSVDTVMERLDIKADAQSYAIHIGFQSRDPDKAAKLANGFANIYIRNQVKARFANIDQAQAWIAKQVANLRADLANATLDMVEFQTRNNLIPHDSQNPGLVSAQQMVNISSDLAQAERDRAEAEARLRQARALTRRGADLSVLTFVSESPFLQELRKEEAKLLAKQAELSGQFLDSAPAMQTVSQQIGRLRGEIVRETSKQIAKLENEVAAERAREASLTQRLDGISKSSRANTKSLAELQQREREIQSKNVVLENFLARYNEIVNRVEIEEPEARIASKAVSPAQPSHPKKALLLGVSFMGSMGLAVSLVFLYDRLRPGFMSTSEIRDSLALPTLGIIPEMRRLPKRETPSDYLLSKPTSVYAEAVRSAQLSVLNARPGESKGILITSSLPGEGKTAFSLSLGRSLAQSGQSTLLVDCDLRRPKVAQLVGCDLVPGFAEFLRGEATLEDIVRHDDRSGLTIIPAGRGGVDPQKLLGSRRAEDALIVFKKNFDVVLVDSPPTMVASDSAILAKACETALYVVEWDKTPRRAVQAGVEYLKSFDIHIAGIVLSKVDLDRQRHYSDYVDFCFRYTDYYDQ